MTSWLTFVPSTIIGQEGADMAAEFNPEPKVYLAMTVPKFPNYFVVNGVRGNWAAGTALISVRIYSNDADSVCWSVDFGHLMPD